MRISGREESATAQQSVMHPRQPEKKMDYSHCPLKKRPVVFKCEFIKEEMDLENNQDCAEPENLSTKPEDLRVKYKSEIAAAALRMKIEPVSPDADKPPSPYPLPPLSPASEYRLGAIAWSPPRPIWSMDASPPPPPPPPERYAQQPYVVSHHHQQPYQQQHPYQPTAVKAGPLEPLCLNAAAGDHHHPAALAASAYHQHRQPYGPAAPRTVPAQYPATGYLSGYMYHHQPHGALAAERAFPPAPPAAAYPQPPAMGRDVSVSPPGSAGSAFRPLSSSHGASPSSAPATSPPSTPATSATAATWSRSSLLAWSQAQYVKLQSSSPGISPPPPPPQTSSTSPPSSTPYIVGPSRQLIAVAPYPQQRHAAAAAATATAAVATIVENNGPSSSAAVKRKTSVGRYKCASCAKTYSSLSGLTKHQHSQHSSDDDSAAVALYGSAIAPASASAAAAAAAANVCTAKTFSCKFCDKTYTTLGALKMHIRTHTLPCLCTLCGKAFSRPWLLQGHIRTHTGEKPFSCSLCHRAFADRSNLRAHLQTHSDVKKYSCPTCSKTFSRMSLLTKHNETGCPRLLQQLPHQQHQQQQHQQQQHEDQEMTEL